MLSEVAAYIVNTWKFQMPKSNSLEDLHLETVFDYVLDDGSAGSQPPVVFDSFHHVTFRTEPMMIDHGGGEMQTCPNPKELKPLAATRNPALVELWRSSCYVDGANPGITPLMEAAARMEVAKVKLLLRNGASVFDSDANGWTPLMYAMVRGNSSILHILVTAGADPNQVSSWGNTPLMISAARGYFHEELVRAGANLNVLNTSGATLLMILADKAGPDEISAALKAGTESTLKDKENRSALDYLYLAACDKSPIREEIQKRETPVRDSCSALDKDGIKSEQLLLSAQGAVQR